MSEDTRIGTVKLYIECLIEKSNEDGKVWVKPLPNRRYLVDESRVEYLQGKGARNEME